MPVAGTLGREGVKAPEAQPHRAAPAEEIAEPTAPPQPPQVQPAKPPSRTVLAEMWLDCAEELRHEPGGNRLGKFMPLVVPKAIRGATFVVEKPADAPNMVGFLITDKRLRDMVEAWLSRRWGSPLRLEMETSAERLEVTRTLKPSEGLRAHPEQPTEAPPQDAERDLPPLHYDDEVLAAEMERHAPAREKLEKLLAENETLRRAVEITQQLTGGKIVRVNDEDL